MLRHLFVSAAVAALLIGGQACGAASTKHPAPTWDGDRDRDGVLDAKDDCPDVPEDFDGYKDSDGCVDDDNDGDGIVDDEDLCPNVKGESPSGCPGIADATERAKMRPGDLDKDGDGIIGARDRCPDDAEDFDGIQDDDGCPETDADGDGVADQLDRCPLAAGPRDRNGCPMIDNDDDGVDDDIDRCKTAKGPKDNGGCPYCVANWSGGDGSIDVRVPSGFCGSISIKVGDMTCSGSIASCSTFGDRFSSTFSCKYDKVNQTVTGSVQMTCTATTAKATLSTAGNTLSWSLTKR